MKGEPLRELALFAGAGGGILGGHLLGWRTVCAVEIEDYPRRVLLARQRDGMLPRFPIWDDVTTFDGLQWRGRVDVISGGFPCQDISSAGKGAGITGARSGLWSHMARIIGEVRPRYCFVENSPMLVSRGLDVVLSDIAALGYSASWGIVGAHHAGAPHKRDRIWIKCELADASGDGSQLNEHERVSGEWPLCGSVKQQGSDGSEQVDNSVCERLEGPHDYRESSERIYPEPSERREAMGHTASKRLQTKGNKICDREKAQIRKANQFRNGGQGIKSCWWQSEPNMGGVVDGLASGLDIHGAASAGDVGRVATGVQNRVGRLKSIGNGQVPLCAALAWEVLSNINQLRKPHNEPD